MGDTIQEVTGPPLLKEQDLSYLKTLFKADYLQFLETDQDIHYLSLPTHSLPPSIGHQPSTECNLQGELQFTG